MLTGGATFTVYQANGCTFGASPSYANLGAGASSGSTFGVTTSGGCDWTASTGDGWIHLTSFSGTGPGSVTYSVDANAGAMRSGTITLTGGAAFTVNQDGAPVCTPPSASSITGATSVITGDGDGDADMLVGYSYSVPSQIGATYAWSVGSGATIWSGQGTTSIQVVYDHGAGPFTVSVTIDNGCGSTTPSLGVTKEHTGFSWDFLGTGTPAAWTNEIGTWSQSGGAYENPAHAIGVPVLYESASYGQVYGNFTVEAEIVVSRTTPATTGAATTLWVRGTPTPLVTGASASRWNRGYAFNIANTGRFSIFKYTPTGNAALQTWVAPAGVTIHTDGVTPNVLRVEATGTTMKFSINGVVVRTLTNQTQYPTGRVGVGMIRTSGAPDDALKVNSMKLAPSGFGLSKGASEGESAEQTAANAAANRLRPRANPLFDDEIR
jgi:hypothetical protein